jgi:hypothetical protein
VSWVDQGGFGEREELAEQAVVLGGGVAVLEIGTSRAANQQGVAREDPIPQQEAVAVVCVPRRTEDIEVKKWMSCGRRIDGKS